MWERQSPATGCRESLRSPDLQLAEVWEYVTHLKTRYPYITMLPQVKFLEFITQEAQKYPSFHLVMGANVQVCYSLVMLPI